MGWRRKRWKSNGRDKSGVIWYLAIDRLLPWLCLFVFCKKFIGRRKSGYANRDQDRNRWKIYKCLQIDFVDWPKLFSMYENKTEPLASAMVYYRRIAGNALRISFLLMLMLLIGTVGYHWATHPFTAWLDAFHNASMILSGMGPVVTSGFTAGGKIFSSLYALFSGIVFVGAMGYIFAPGIHRIFHKLHLEQKKWSLIGFPFLQRQFEQSH